MANDDTAGTAEQASARPRSKLPILLGTLLALGLGGAGFFAAYSGRLPIASEQTPEDSRNNHASIDRQVHSFVPLEPMVVSLGTPGNGRHLRFKAEVEVVPGMEDHVIAVMPRIIDMLNGYLRAVPIEELESPSALVLLRAQMLRRIQLIMHDGAVKDMLIMEFVLD